MNGISNSNNLVLGTAQIGLPYGIANKTGQPDPAVAVAIINEAWGQGIREFDTAQGYGVSEEILGKALSEIGITNEAGIISKFDPNIDHLNETAMSDALDRSVKRLGVPMLSGIMLHREELFSLWDKGLAKVLQAFVTSGRVKRVGVSVYSPDKAIEALNTDGIDMVQLPTNILDRRFENAGVFRLAEKKKKQIYIRSVFLQGLLLMDPEEIPAKMAFAVPVLEKFKTLSHDLGLTRQEVALGFLKVGFPHAHVIFGAETQDQVKQNALIWKKKMPELLRNKVRTLFSDVSEKILNPVLW